MMNRLLTSYSGGPIDIQVAGIQATLDYTVLRTGWYVPYTELAALPSAGTALSITVVRTDASNNRIAEQSTSSAPVRTSANGTTTGGSLGPAGGIYAVAGEKLRFYFAAVTSASAVTWTVRIFSTDLQGPTALIYRAERGKALDLYLPLMSNDTFTLNPTIAAGDAMVSTDGAAFANLTTLPAETPANGRLVKFSLSAAEMNGNSVVLRMMDQTSPPEWGDLVVNIATMPSSYLAKGIVATASSGSTTLDSGAAAVGSKYKGARLVLYFQDGTSEERMINSYSAGRVCSHEAFVGVADNTTAYAIFSSRSWILDSVFESARSIAGLLRLIQAKLWGKRSGGGTGTNVYKGEDAATTRITEQVDSSGNSLSTPTLNDS